MALKQIILGDKLRKARERLEQAQHKAEEARSQRTELETREAELTQAREEVTEDTTPEEQQVLEEQINAWMEQEEALQETEAQISQEIEEAQQEVADLQQQLDEVNARGAAKPKTPENTKPEERKEHTAMNTNTRKLWFGMDHQERDAFVAREDVKTFAQRVRDMIGEKRTVKGAELTIPKDMLPLIRTVAEESSKLIKHVNLQRVRGESRANVTGLIPEAVWTDMCGKINEVEWAFGQIEMDGYKVAAGLYLCNAIVEDSDLDLITEVLNMLGKAIGLALDKAILYGTGTKMPMGIVTRLAQTAEPEGYSANAPEWKNLSATNLLAVSGKTGAELFKALVEATGAINSDYAAGTTFWAMNRKTKIKLVSHALSINAAGAVVTGLDNTMPVIGGKIEELNFIPDDVIIGGYGDMYTLVERADMKFAYSTEFRFMDDQTAFKGTARYDGMPVVADAFVAIGIGGTKPAAAAVTFAQDKANA